MARFGFKKRAVATTGNVSQTLELYPGSPEGSPKYVFDENGRLSTSTHAGATIDFPDTYSRGEAWELRFRTADADNGQFQGIFLQVRSDVANSSTIRGIEVEARQGADTIAIGTLIGITAAAHGAGTTGAITTAIGLDAQVQMDSDSTYTVTNLYGMRVKLQIEDGATITNGYAIWVDHESVTGSPTGNARMDAVLGVTATTITAGVFRYGIDTTRTEFTNGSGNEVVLWAFKGADGTTYYMVHDTDSATAIGVVTTDPTT